MAFIAFWNQTLHIFHCSLAISSGYFIQQTLSHLHKNDDKHVTLYCISELKMEQKTDTSVADDLQHADVNMTDEHKDYPTITGKKYFILFPVKTSKPQEDTIRNFLQQTPGLEEVSTVAECDFILFLCIIVSRAGTDIDAAVNELNAISESIPAVFIVLHHTFDPEKMVTDSSRYVTRKNTLTVDCLFYEDQLLNCVRNKEALDRIEQCFLSQQDIQTKRGKFKEPAELKMEQKTDDNLQHADMNMTDEHKDDPTITGNKYLVLFSGKISNLQEDIRRNVLQQTPGLEEVSTVAECDFILVFCIIVSRAGTDIDAAVNELNAISESIPAVFMVLHPTFDPEKMVPDSSRYVTRKNTLTVDCLFYEDQLLNCVRNKEALDRIEQCLPQKDTQTKRGKLKASPGKMDQQSKSTEEPKHNSYCNLL